MGMAFWRPYTDIWADRIFGDAFGLFQKICKNITLHGYIWHSFLSEDDNHRVIYCQKYLSSLYDLPGSDDSVDDIWLQIVEFGSKKLSNFYSYCLSF